MESVPNVSRKSGLLGITLLLPCPVGANTRHERPGPRLSRFLKAPGGMIFFFALGQHFCAASPQPVCCRTNHRTLFAFLLQRALDVRTFNLSSDLDTDSDRSISLPDEILEISR